SPVCFTTLEPTHLRDEAEKLARGHVAVSGRAFRQVADLLAGGDAIGLDIVAQDAGAARCGRQIARHHLHGGGFARAVGAEEAEHLALGDNEIDSGDRYERSEVFGQALDFNHGRAENPVMRGKISLENSRRARKTARLTDTS